MIPYETHKVIFQHLFDFGFAQIRWIFPSYTLMMSLGIIAGMLFARKKYLDIPLRVKIFAFFICGIFAMAGGKLFYLVFYTKTAWYLIPIRMFEIWRVGMVSVGGLTFLVITIAILCKYYKLNVMKVLNDIAPSLVIGLFFGRIGCFLAGCCYGSSTNFALAIAMNNIHVHPTQLYSSFFDLIIFISLVIISYYTKKVFAWLLILYGSFRFTIEFIRINPDIIFGLSNQQLWSIIMIILGLYILFRKK
jgi:phosphatidylglycerol---prolipoprotein diacylglyceryl transferase